MTTRTTHFGTRTVTAPRKAGLVNAFLTALSILRERHRLAELDADALRDIGRSPEEAENEAKRAVWDAPERWLS